MKIFRKIIELVDIDVVAHWAALSAIAADLPFLPFMIFVDGPPADRFPLLASAALATSICWLLFVTWRLLLHLNIKFLSPGKASASLGILLVVFGILVAILLSAAGEIWLSEKIGWPEAYGFSCHRRDCLIQNLANSPKLLKGGSSIELALFALLWLNPATIASALIYVVLKRILSPKNLSARD